MQAIKRKSRISKIQIQKHQMFQQIFRECEAIFPCKQFQFFVNYIIPHKHKNPTSKNKFLKNNQFPAQDQNQVDINQINPHVLTMPRKLDFYAQRPVLNIMSEKKSRRMLTSPTEKQKNVIKFDTFSQLQFYKKMRNYKQQIGKQNTYIGSMKLYSPQPLFGHHTKNLQKPSPIYQMHPQALRKSSRQRQKFNRHKQTDSNHKFSMSTQASAVPEDFIQMLKLSNKTLQQIRCSRTAMLKSVR